MTLINDSECGKKTSDKSLYVKEQDRWNKIAKKHWDSAKEKSLRILLDERDFCRAFPDKIWEMLTAELPDFQGKKVLVPSSGDNFIVYAFSLLGANVTSADFSPCMICKAEERAEKFKLNSIQFIEADSITLGGLPDDEYDLVFTSNGVYNNLSNIEQVHRSFFRVLKPDGIYCLFENYSYVCSAKTEDKEDLTYSQNAWTKEDFENSIVNSGFIICDCCDIFRNKNMLPIYFENNARYSNNLISAAWRGIIAKTKPTQIGTE